MTEAGVSIPLTCYDGIESRAKQRTDWIAEHHKKLQQEEEKRLIEAAIQKKNELDEKFDNGEFSDGSDQEQEHAQRQINEQVDGLTEYQHNIPLSRIKYNDFI